MSFYKGPIKLTGTAPITATPKPFTRDPAAYPGSTLLGSDGEIYQSLQVGGSSAYRWCRLVAADPVLGWIETPAVLAGEAARSIDEPGLILRIKDDAFAGEVYAIGTPGQQDFGLGAVPPTDLPEGYLPLDGTVYGGRNYATYVYVPSDGSSAEMLPGLGGSFVLRRFAIGQQLPYVSGSLLMDPEAGASGTVNRQGRVQHHGVPEVASLDDVDAETVPGLQVRTPNGKVYQSQRWGGAGPYRWGLLAGVNPSTNALDISGGLDISGDLDVSGDLNIQAI
jgi:hypothetical protein